MTKLTLACGLALSLSLMACASTPQPATAVPAASGSTAVPTAGTSTAQTSTKPKLICEEDKPLGSLLPQRICMTPEEAAARQRAAQQKMRDIQEQSAVGPGMGSSSGG